MFKMPANERQPASEWASVSPGEWEKKVCKVIHCIRRKWNAHNTRQDNDGRTERKQKQKQTKQAKTNGKQTNQFYSKQIAINFT